MLGFGTGYMALTALLIVSAGLAMIMAAAFTIVNSKVRRCAVCHRDFKGESTFRDHAKTHGTVVSLPKAA